MGPETAGAAGSLVSLFLKLARVPSPSGQERGVNDLIITRLEGLGLEVREGEPLREGPGGAGNIFCRVPASSAGIPILLSAHTDTVASEPGAFPDPVLEGGVISSGSRAVLGADDKAGVAAILHSVERIIEEDLPHPAIELLLTVGEEGGLLGSKAWSPAEATARCGFCFDSTGPVGSVIVRSPSQMTIKALFKGSAAHAGVEPEKGRSAVAAAAAAVAAMRLGRIDEETTANIGVIRGGEAVNVVPDRCTIAGEARSHVPERLDAQVAGMMDAINEAAAAGGVDAEITVAEEFRGFDFSGGNQPLELAEQAIAGIGLKAVRASTGGGSDVNVLNTKGISCINLSAGMESVHTPEEFISVEELEKVHLLIMALVAGALKRGEAV